MLVYAVISYNVQEGIDLYNIYSSVEKAAARVKELKKIASDHGHVDSGYDVVVYDAESGYPTGQTYYTLMKAMKGGK